MTNRGIILMKASYAFFVRPLIFTEWFQVSINRIFNRFDDFIIDKQFCMLYWNFADYRTLCLSDIEFLIVHPASDV